MKNMDTKKYIAPECEVMEVETVCMIAASEDLGFGDEWEDNELPMDANKHRGEWGNLWADWGKKE